jgi:hypothetical protein
MICVDPRSFDEMIQNQLVRPGPLPTQGIRKPEFPDPRFDPSRANLWAGDLEAGEFRGRGADIVY